MRCTRPEVGPKCRRQAGHEGACIATHQRGVLATIHSPTRSAPGYLWATNPWISMHGFGPRIYDALPRKGPYTDGVTVRDLAALATVHGRNPNHTTIRLHLRRLASMGLVEHDAGMPAKWVRLTDTTHTQEAQAVAA